MKTINLFYFFLASLLCLSACTKEENPTLTISQTSIHAQAGENITTITLNANNPWSVTSPEWCTVTPSSGNGNGDIQVVITVKKNNSFVARECSLTFVSLELEACISVFQDQKEMISYVDEYGVNQGKGILIGNTVWAPVNCGYKASTATDKGYPYGKLYQLGRKYGQGYSKIYDATAPYDDNKVVQGPVELSVGQDPSNQDNFYIPDIYISRNWVKGLTLSECSKLWNSGTEESPIKTSNDPCPDGWRVATVTEWKNLQENRPFFSERNGQKGCFYGDDLFIPAGGYCFPYDGVPKKRDEACYYWTSSFSSSSEAALSAVYYIGSSLGSGTGGTPTENSAARGYSVRCVME